MSEIDEKKEDSGVEGIALAEEVSAMARVRDAIAKKKSATHGLVAVQLEDKVALANILFPDNALSVGEIEEMYPARLLKEGAMVTRVAPSPTGFMHIGGIYVALISERLARQTNGVFYLRIEDTDRKREVEGASDLIVSSMERYGINIDEGKTPGTDKELGDYGPYKQSERAELYRAFAKKLVGEGKAYPCFCSGEELDAMRTEQEAKKVRPGYYGEWAKCRGKSEDDVAAELAKGKPFVVRFKSQGNFDNKVLLKDMLKGNKELSQNDQDAVVIKSDGLPTYHFAHVVDDHLMRTTDVIRGDEWVSSAPLHLELFQALDWQVPRYGHIMPIQKMDGNSKRKLSKRKDPEASVTYYDEQGYPEDAVIEYLLNLANSNFEDWRKQYPGKDSREFPLSLERLAHSNGALFDFKKLNDISREIIARYTAEEVYQKVVTWAQRNNPVFAELLSKDPGYAVKIFGIERGDAKARKDIAKWSDVESEVGFFFDDKFNLSPEEARQLLQGIDPGDIKLIVNDFKEVLPAIGSKDEWLARMREIGVKHGYAESTKAYKAKPDAYKGYIADVTKIFRVLLAGKTQTPDLYSIMQVMGNEKVMGRLALIDKI